MCALVTGVQTCALPIWPRCRGAPRQGGALPGAGEPRRLREEVSLAALGRHAATRLDRPRALLRARSPPDGRAFRGARRDHPRPPERAAPAALRSEEHTSELQSLMRNSYAVFCLKTHNTTNTKHIYSH